MVRCPREKKLSVSRAANAKACVFPCGDGRCQDNVLAEGIQCDDCATWYHQKCSQLSAVIFKLYCRYSKLQWTCLVCKHTLSGLNRMDVGVDNKLISSTNTPGGKRREINEEDRLVCTESPESNVEGRSFKEKNKLGNKLQGLVQDRIPVSDLGTNNIGLDGTEDDPYQKPDTVDMDMGSDSGNEVLPVEQGSGTEQSGKQLKRRKKKRDTKKVGSNSTEVHTCVESTDGKVNEIEGKTATNIGYGTPLKPPKKRKQRVMGKNTSKKIERLVHGYEGAAPVGECLGTSVTDRLDKIEAVLKGQAYQLEQFRKLSEIATGRNRNILVYGVPEPYIREGQQRERAIRFHIINLLRLVEMPGHTGLKRVQRLGRWNKAESEVKPRPVLVEFSNPRHRDHFLALAEKIRAITQGGITVGPDNIRKVLDPKSRDGTIYGFNTAKLRSPRINLEKISTSIDQPERVILKESHLLNSQVNMSPARTFREALINNISPSGGGKGTPLHPSQAVNNRGNRAVDGPQNGLNIRKKNGDGARR